MQVRASSGGGVKQLKPSPLSPHPPPSSHVMCAVEQSLGLSRAGFAFLCACRQRRSLVSVISSAFGCSSLGAMFNVYCDSCYGLGIVCVLSLAW